MTQFIGYHIDGWNTNKSVPIATGMTKDEAQEKAIKRILGACILDGYIQVQERDDVSVEDFEKLTKLVDDFAKSKGLQ